MDRMQEILEERYALERLKEPCPYLPDRTSRMLFLDGSGLGTAYRKLLDEGYRRTGAFVYRPACDNCRACETIRVPLETFRRSKSQRRIWNRGQTAFDIRVGTPSVSAEKVALYRDYLLRKHDTTDRDITEQEYAFVFAISCLGERTREIQLRANGRLVGLGVVDCVGDAMSSVYFYYDMDYERLSPGTYSILAEIHLAQAWGFNYYYLGHYIEQCDSMNYKANFRPCEVRTQGSPEWRRIE